MLQWNLSSSSKQVDSFLGCREAHRARAKMSDFRKILRRDTVVIIPVLRSRTQRYLSCCEERYYPFAY